MTGIEFGVLVHWMNPTPLHHNALYLIHNINILLFESRQAFRYVFRRNCLVFHRYSMQVPGSYCNIFVWICDYSLWFPFQYVFIYIFFPFRWKLNSEHLHIKLLYLYKFKKKLLYNNNSIKNAIKNVKHTTNTTDINCQ